MVICYEVPTDWIRYNVNVFLNELLEAKASILALTQMPSQKSWADKLQQMQLKREVAGTSRIEGADLTEKELDKVMRATPEEMETLSQRQAAAAVVAYRWIASLPADRPLDVHLICEAHRRLVTNCDDDHCSPGQFRGRDQNVTFGIPKHRGCEGGPQCGETVEALVRAIQTTFRSHDPIIQALAVHYHFAAMHPFLDGNGRTARALEAIMLQRLGLRDTLFIAMSNYYYEQKTGYLTALSETRAAGHDLTPFLKFALRGVESQCRRLFEEIRLHVTKALFRNTATDLFARLKSPRKTTLSKRHLQVLFLLLEEEEIRLDALVEKTRHHYAVRNPQRAVIRDLNYLVRLNAIFAKKLPDGAGYAAYLISINLDWPTKITDTEFFRQAKALPKGKTYGFLSS